MADTNLKVAVQTVLEAPKSTAGIEANLKQLAKELEAKQLVKISVALRVDTSSLNSGLKAATNSSNDLLGSLRQVTEQFRLAPTLARGLEKSLRSISENGISNVKYAPPHSCSAAA